MPSTVVNKYPVENVFTAEPVPHGKTFSRFSIGPGLKKALQKGRSELFLNATDIANTLNLKREVRGNDFRYVSTDYYETQALRVGDSYKFRGWNG